MRVRALGGDGAKEKGPAEVKRLLEAPSGDWNPLFGEAAVDMPAGPSEILILTDGSVPAPWIAADLRAQAEHAPDARAVLVSTDSAIAAHVRDLVDGDLAEQVRVLTATDLEQAVAFANDFAPEHLTLACAEPDRWLARRNRATLVPGTCRAPSAAG